jgi:hypothetical protein
MQFVNFIGQDLSAATYILPGVEHDDDEQLLVTVSKFASGVKAQELGPEAPWTWQLDEAAARAEGAWWSKFRGNAIEYAAVYPEGYETFPMWDTFQDGW